MDINKFKQLTEELIAHKKREANSKNEHKSQISFKFFSSLPRHNNQSINVYLRKTYGISTEFNFTVNMIEETKKYNNNFIIYGSDNYIGLKVNDGPIFGWDIDILLSKSGLTIEEFNELIMDKKISVTFRQRFKKSTGRVYDAGTYINILKKI